MNHQSANSAAIRTIAVTGALGNLGTKLFRHLVATGRAYRLIGLDVRSASEAPQQVVPGVEYIACDLADWQDLRWRNALAGVDALVHFAAQNPYPEASWQEAAVSLDMTLHLANAAVEQGVRRLVFATSNHVMGRYKDDPLWSQTAAGELRPDSPPAVGTVWHTGSQAMDSTAYATAKLMGERVWRSAAIRSAGRTSAVCVRIGWCQPGENLPTTLSAAGTPTQATGTAAVDAEAWARADRWFKEMWLSNRDFVQLFERAILADGGAWPDGYLLVNGMSANRGMKWSLAETIQGLGYAPQDDVYGSN